MAVLFRWHRNLGILLISFCLAIALHSCTNTIIDEYQATATTTITWRVEYFLNDNIKNSRFEEFASNSLTNVNGQKPQGAFSGPDDQGLWWPDIPPKPSLDDIDARRRQGERNNNPERLRTVDYQMTFSQGNTTTTLPTNNSVYRRASQAYENGQALKLTLGVNDASVQKAEPW